jgi:AcrR family transcriptional regulator
LAADTRRRILDVALASFLERGYEGTTTALIRERSGVSNGTLFHHFPSKEAIATALHVEAIASFQEGLWELAERRPRSPRAAVRDAVAHQLGWIEEHPDLARFLYMRGQLEPDAAATPELAEHNRKLAAAYAEWLGPLQERGEIRQTSMLVVTAIVTGPGHSIAQRWLAGQLDAPLSSFVDELADAAWAALRGRAS